MERLRIAEQPSSGVNSPTTTTSSVLMPAPPAEVVQRAHTEPAPQSADVAMEEAAPPPAGSATPVSQVRPVPPSVVAAPSSAMTSAGMHRVHSDSNLSLTSSVSSAEAAHAEIHPIPPPPAFTASRGESVGRSMYFLARIIAAVAPGDQEKFALFGYQQAAEMHAQQLQLQAQQEAESKQAAANSQPGCRDRVHQRTGRGHRRRGGGDGAGGAQSRGERTHGAHPVGVDAYTIPCSWQPRPLSLRTVFHGRFLPSLERVAYISRSVSPCCCCCCR